MWSLIHVKLKRDSYDKSSLGIQCFSVFMSSQWLCYRADGDGLRKVNRARTLSETGPAPPPSAACSTGRFTQNSVPPHFWMAGAAGFLFKSNRCDPEVPASSPPPSACTLLEFWVNRPFKYQPGPKGRPRSESVAGRLFPRSEASRPTETGTQEACGILRNGFCWFFFRVQSRYEVHLPFPSKCGSVLLLFVRVCRVSCQHCWSYWCCAAQEVDVVGKQ